MHASCRFILTTISYIPEYCFNLDVIVMRGDKTLLTKLLLKRNEYSHIKKITDRGRKGMFKFSLMKYIRFALIYHRTHQLLNIVVIGL